LHNWLFCYEFAETILSFTNNKLHILASESKKQYLGKMEKPDNYSGPEVEIFIKLSKEDPNKIINDFFRSTY
jgi:nucleosome binding factor SPN SPT16 subunit